MVDPRHAVLAAALVVASVAAGLAVPSPPEDAGATAQEEGPSSRLERAVEAWDFSGFSGNVTISNASIGWLDIAFPWTENTSISYHLQRTWPSGGVYWACGYEGVTAYPTRYTVGSSGMCAAGRNGGGNQTDVVLRAGPVDENATVGTPTPSIAPNPDAGVLCERCVDIDDPGVDRPVVHYTTFTGGVSPETFELTFSWSNTTPRVRTGPLSDTFAYTTKDFDSTVYAHVDNPSLVAPMASSAATLETELIRDSPTTVWAWVPTGWDDATIVRPDGSRVGEGTGVEDYMVIEATQMMGTWQFHVENQTSRTWDPPILMGASYRRASFSWQTPNFG